MDILYWVLFILIGFAAGGWRDDIKRWNGGICPKNGEKWIHIDTDSQGGRLYRAGKYTTWISWPVGDKNRKQ